MKFGPFLFLLLPVATVAAAESPIPTAVLRFDGPRLKENHITDAIMGALGKDPRFAVFEREQINKVLNEQSLGVSGIIDPKTAAGIGRLTGVKILIVGERIAEGDDRDTAKGKNTLVARTIGIETGRVYTDTVSAGDGNRPTLQRLAAELAAKIAATIVAHADELMLGAPSRDQRIDKMTRNASARRPRRIAVTIDESRSGRKSVLATTETELGLVLNKAGFVLVDAKSEAKPEIEIIGEARAEAGITRNGLFSGRAVLDVKVRDVAARKIIRLDRATGEAVDIGEQIATNLALEDAADTLATRIVPLLMQ